MDKFVNFFRNNVANFKIDVKVFAFIFISFIFMTIFGTLTHELGHIAVAKSLGYETTLNYQSMTYSDKKYKIFIDYTLKKYRNEITEIKPFPNRELFITTMKRYSSDIIWITLGGPLQTMITGTLAFILLLILKGKLISENNVKFRGWLLIFLSLSWLRQVANLFVGLLFYFNRGYISYRGDEVRLSIYSGINIWSIDIITAIIGVIILLIITFKIIPRRLILTFLSAGLLGGIAGYYLWIIKFGKYILP